MPEAHRDETDGSLGLLCDGPEVCSSDGAHLGVETLGLLLGSGDRPPEAVDHRLRRRPLLGGGQLVSQPLHLGLGGEATLLARLQL